MQNKSSARFFHRPVLIALFLFAAACSMLCATLVGSSQSRRPSNSSQRTLTFEDRVAYQRLIEEIYWRHRIWPKERPDPKPSLDSVMSKTQLEKKVTDYLRKSHALDDYQQPITAEQLQAEMDRMAQRTRQPEVLRELFEALGNDPFVIAECLARPALSERFETNSYAYDQRVHGELKQVTSGASANYALPAISDGPNGCIDDTWTDTSTINAPSARDDHTAVWTGSEMIVWGGYDGSELNTGGRYNPSTDSWAATSTANAPAGRDLHTAVWTGSQMIVWGGQVISDTFVNSGAKYDPSTDSWTAISTANAPAPRLLHTAVWAGSEMIVWGGLGDAGQLNTGGRYNPGTDSWTAISTANAPTARDSHTAVWTGSQMIVWGGENFSSPFYFNTGGRYNPGTDSWSATSIINAPDARASHTAVWTGTETIVWGGFDVTSVFDTGGRYNPVTDSWTATSTNNAPSARELHTTVWTGNEMIVWGGSPDGSIGLNTGGTYNPSTNSWTATSTTNAPLTRELHTAVRAGSEMIVWGGYFYDGSPHYLNTGGRYCAQSGPTPTVTPSPSATPTPTATPCMGRCTPTPRSRPTPHPRP